MCGAPEIGLIPARLVSIKSDGLSVAKGINNHDSEAERYSSSLAMAHAPEVKIERVFSAPQDAWARTLREVILHS